MLGQWRTSFEAEDTGVTAQGTITMFDRVRIRRVALGTTSPLWLPGCRKIDFRPLKQPYR